MEKLKTVWDERGCYLIQKRIPRRFFWREQITIFLLLLRRNKRWVRPVFIFIVDQKWRAFGGQNRTSALTPAFIIFIFPFRVLSPRLCFLAFHFPSHFIYLFIYSHQRGGLGKEKVVNVSDRNQIAWSFVRNKTAPCKLLDSPRICSVNYILRSRNGDQTADQQHAIGSRLGSPCRILILIGSKQIRCARLIRFIDPIFQLTHSSTR